MKPMANSQQPAESKASTTRIERGLEEGASWWDGLLGLPVVWAVVAVIGCTWLVLPRVGAGPPDWQPGEVASFDLVIPVDITLPDEGATRAARQEAAASILPVYDLEPRLRLELEDELRILFEGCRAQMELGDQQIVDLEAITDLRATEDMLRIVDSTECSDPVETALIAVVNQVFRDHVVDDRRALERRGSHGVTVRNLASGSERVADIDEFSSAVDIRTGLEQVLRARLIERAAVARRWIKPLVDFLEANIGPDLVFNRAETAQRSRAAAEAVLPRSRELRRGQVLVRRGDTVTEEVADTLLVLQRQRRDVTSWARVAGIGLLVALMVIGWWPIMSRTGSPAEIRRRLSSIFLLVLLFAAADRLGLYIASAVAFNSQGEALSTAGAYLWGLPFAAGPVTVLVLFGLQPALLFSLCGAGLAGLLLGGDFAVAIYALASGAIGAFAAQRSRDRASLSRVGAIVGIVNVLLVLVLQLYRGLPDSPATVGLSALCALVGGPLSVGVVSFLLPVLESAFGITTNSRLLELSNQNLPLLKRLSLEAPGTYQHSLSVSNLAEAGADAVGANALLLRVCAYYHDVGKLVKPDYFVENQRNGNPHDALLPSMSALVIMSHVKEGLEIAREAKLPLPIRQGIATHHGTKLIRFFFNRAQERSGEDKSEVRESDYRYPGPKPHTKELGILLLADAVEAAARTLENPSPAKIQAMIDKIFSNALEDDQLDDCDLTFSELDKVASAFLWVLTNMYHHRIDYPGFDFNRRQQTGDPGPHQVGTKAVSTRG
jgi:putative nucleotidyltransferase with HDIG domain